MSVTLAVKPTEHDPDQNTYGQSKVNTPLKGESDKSFGNFHANLLNTGKNDDFQQKAGRMAAMKRRMSKPY